MKVGYARVSTKVQQESLTTQRDTLQADGCQRVFEDTASGVKSDRPGLAAAIDYRCCCKVGAVGRPAWNNQVHGHLLRSAVPS